MDGNKSSCPDSVSEVEEYSSSTFGVVYALLSFAYFLIGLVCYYIRRKYSIYLQRRRFSLIVLISVGLSFSFLSGVKEYVGRDEYSCLFSYVSALAVVILGFGGQLARAFMYLTTLKYKRKLSDFTFWGFVTEPLYKGVLDVGKTAPKLHRTDSNLSKSDLFLDDSRKVSHDYSSFEYRVTDLENYTPDEEVAKMPSDLTRAKMMASMRFCLGLILFLVSLFLIFALYSVIKLNGCFGCERTFNGLQWLIASSATAGVSIVLSYAVLSNSTDPLWIREEISICFVICIIFTALRDILAYTDPNSLETEGSITWDYISSAGYIVAFTIMVPGQIWISFAEESHAGEDLDNLIQFLHNSEARQFFKQHLVKDLSIENYLFWREATNWKRDFMASNQAERVERFLKLYYIFISSDSILSVNVGGAVRGSIAQVAEDIQKNPERLTYEIFDGAIGDALMMMRTHSWPRFIASDLYTEYIREYAQPRLTNKSRRSIGSLRAPNIFARRKSSENSGRSMSLTSRQSSWATDKRQSSLTNGDSPGHKRQSSHSTLPWDATRNDSAGSLTEVSFSK